eukprot:COSAG04_NODE_21905_length_365_cov_0.503759_1_plen_58_part_10
MTTTNSYFEGGFNSAGVFAYGAAATQHCINGVGPDEPDATWDTTFRGCDYVDFAAWYV